MSTKSLDLSLPLRHHQRQPSNELSSIHFTKDLKSKIADGNKLQCYEELGARLIEDRLLLTALELYAELGEAGHEIPCLKQFFSNPGNFEKSAKTEVSRLLVRSLSQTTLDSLDFAPVSEDGDRACGADRVAVLEFELRKAKETIMALRENLTQQVELENASTRSETESTSSQNAGTATAHISTQEPIRAYEQRAINYLVHEYLLTHGYRLTSITFADENADQDFEHWDDVGLNTERPPDLLTIFRHRNRPTSSNPNVSKTAEAVTQTEDVPNECDSADVTMQIAGMSTEESGDNTNHEVALPLAPPVKTGPTRDIPVISNNLPSAINAPVTTAIRQSVISGAPLPPAVPHAQPTDVPFSSPTVQLQNSARALKDELQQGVEDVCQKLNSFFGKPQSLTTATSNRHQTQTGGFIVGRPVDRASFSLFNTK